MKQSLFKDYRVDWGRNLSQGFYFLSMHKIILQGYLGPKKDIQVLLQDFMTRTEIKVLFKFKYSFLDLLIFFCFLLVGQWGEEGRGCVCLREEREREGGGGGGG